MSTCPRLKSTFRESNTQKTDSFYQNVIGFIATVYILYAKIYEMFEKSMDTWYKWYTDM